MLYMVLLICLIRLLLKKILLILWWPLIKEKLLDMKNIKNIKKGELKLPMNLRFNFLSLKNY